MLVGMLVGTLVEYIGRVYRQGMLVGHITVPSLVLIYSDIVVAE